MLQQTLKFDRYAAVHKDPQGPGDARPTALQIVQDEKLEGQLSDKTILVTGGSSGIGIETVRALAHTGANVIVGVRNTTKGQDVIDDILHRDSIIRADQLELLEMDLNSLASVRQAAQTFLSTHKELHLLICNAGIGGVSQGKTTDGHESHIGVNHFAHFLFFQLLKPTLLASSTPTSNSRVIVVSSGMQRHGTTHLSDLDFEHTPYDPARAYASSKTANIWFANDLDRRYGAQGLHAISLHPGGIETGFQAHGDPGFVALMDQMYARYPEIPSKLFKDVEQGAATTVLAAVGRDFEGVGGIFLDDCQVARLFEPDKDLPYAPGYSEWAFDPHGERKLWEMSLGIVGVEEQEEQRS